MNCGSEILRGALLAPIAALLGLSLSFGQATPADPTAVAAGHQGKPGDKIPLSILYAGMPDTQRQADFIAFLSRHFEKVRAVDVLAFDEAQAAGADVVLLDKDGVQWGARGGHPLYELKVSDAYASATITLGIPGAFWCDRMDLKPGYR